MSVSDRIYIAKQMLIGRSFLRRRNLIFQRGYKLSFPVNLKRRSGLCWVAAHLVAMSLVASAEAEPLGEIPDYRVLLIGNSHSSRARLPDMLQELLEADGANAAAEVKALGNWDFLAERLEDNTTQKALDSSQWTHVVLQAQKYSTTGKYYYPTDAAEEWIRRVRKRGAKPILFPEWARREHPDETLRIHCLHLGIASREYAPVAPVGLAWHIMRATHPETTLFNPDGNHANRRGALLTAYVLYRLITGESPNGLPYIKIRGVPTDTQAMLRSAAGRAFEIPPDCKPDASPLATPEPAISTLDR